MKIEANNPCIVCGAAKSQVFHDTSYKNHHYPGGFCLRKCNSCGLLFNSPRLVDDEIANLYDKNYYVHRRNLRQEIQRAVAVLQRIRQISGSSFENGTVAEIGSARGYLLALLQSLGAKVQGIELSQSAAKYAKKKLTVNTYCGSIESYSALNKSTSFDTVLAIDVIEHVLNPLQFLKTIYTLVSSDGILIIDTPNGAAASIGQLGTAWPGFNPFHIYLFSINNLTLLLEHAGFSLVSAKTYNNLSMDKITNHENKAIRRIKRVLKSIYGIAENLAIDSHREIRRRASEINKSRVTLSNDSTMDNILILAKKNGK